MKKSIFLLIVAMLFVANLIHAQVGPAPADMDYSLYNGYYKGTMLEKNAELTDLEVNNFGEIFVTQAYGQNSVSKYDQSGNLSKRLILPFPVFQVKVLPNDDLIAVGTLTTGTPPLQRAEIAIAKFDRNLQLDPSFGTNGIASKPLGLSHQPSSAVIQNDGRIVVGGAYFPAIGQPKQVFVYRFTPFGDIDSSFGNSGVIYENITGGTVTSLAIQGNNIVASGHYYHPGSPSGIFTTVYNEYGIREPNFNGGNIFFGLGGSVLVQPNDFKIVIGNANTPGGNLTLYRLLPNGVIDTSFGINGIATLPASPAFNSLSYPNIALDMNGKIVVAARGQNFSTPGILKMVVARFTSAGFLDSKFKSSFQQIVPTGSIIPNFGTVSQPEEDPRDIAVQRDGRILVLGLLQNRKKGIYDSVITRLNGN